MPEDDITVVMHILYNKTRDDYGVVGAPGFLDKKKEAYAALKMAEKSLDEYYAKTESIAKKIVTFSRTACNRTLFRNFIRKP